jgi:hydroxyethylthiazole kinase-like uncharacterized protein yjeF
MSLGLIILMTKWIDNTTEILSVSEMYKADEEACTTGLTSLNLMESAGAAIAEVVQNICNDGRILILCGLGNNGGDGFVAARLLKNIGRNVRVVCLGTIDEIKGDARESASNWTDEIGQFSPSIFEDVQVVVDALFGIGLNRPVSGLGGLIIEKLNETDLPCISVDIPSGVHGDTGQILGSAVQADVCVTFFRRKPGHLLYPGKDNCGDVMVADIGIPVTVFKNISPKIYENTPQLWLDDLPIPKVQGHKYDRGHAIVVGGNKLTGAAQLASFAALRSGAGLVTIASPPTASIVYRSGSPSIMVKDLNNDKEFSKFINHSRVKAILIGPGNGTNRETYDKVLTALASKPCVLDADALTVFEECPEVLFSALKNTSKIKNVITPHEGEFKRLFSNVISLKNTRSKIEIARSASSINAIIVLKGADTIITSPSGLICINTNSSPYLATAGSGDVLSGIILGLMAQGMKPFQAACAGVWLHAESGRVFGPGLVAEDITEMLPSILRKIIL